MTNYAAKAVGSDDLSAIHPCAIDVELITPTRFRIVYQHILHLGICSRCGESIDWTKFRNNRAPVDTGKPDA